jgi:tRNA-dihydrouridine synthase B
MAGVTDRPFRQLCKKLGAGLAVSEMVTSNSLLYGSAKTRRRANHEGEAQPVSVQIAGADPAMMAQAARYNVDHGAQIIDINMGCPAKKVCNVMAGSALLQNEPLVGRILDAVVQAVPVPVTLKIRTGWDKSNKNALAILKIAEEAGIRAWPSTAAPAPAATRVNAEYETIAAVKAEARIPIIANGDINSPEKARQVLDATGADARHDRPRRPGPALDLPRDRALPRHRREAAAAAGRRNPPGTARPPGRALCLLRLGNRRARRAQAHLLVHQGPGRRRPVSATP